MSKMSILWMSFLLFFSLLFGIQIIADIKIQLCDYSKECYFLYSNQYVALHLFLLLLNLIAIIYSGYKLNNVLEHRKMIQDLIMKKTDNIYFNAEKESKEDNPDVELRKVEFEKKLLEKQLAEIKEIEQKLEIENKLKELGLKEIPLKFRVEKLNAHKEEKLKNLKKLIEKEISLLNPIECSLFSRLFDSNSESGKS